MHFVKVFCFSRKRIERQWGISRNTQKDNSFAVATPIIYISSTYRKTFGRKRGKRKNFWRPSRIGEREREKERQEAEGGILGDKRQDATTGRTTRVVNYLSWNEEEREKISVGGEPMGIEAAEKPLVGTPDGDPIVRFSRGAFHPRFLPPSSFSALAIFLYAIDGVIEVEQSRSYRAVSCKFLPFALLSVYCPNSPSNILGFCHFLYSPVCNRRLAWMGGIEKNTLLWSSIFFEGAYVSPFIIIIVNRLDCREISYSPVIRNLVGDILHLIYDLRRFILASFFHNVYISYSRISRVYILCVRIVIWNAIIYFVKLLSLLISSPIKLQD